MAVRGTGKACGEGKIPTASIRYVDESVRRVSFAQLRLADFADQGGGMRVDTSFATQMAPPWRPTAQVLGVDLPALLQLALAHLLGFDAQI